MIMERTVALAITVFVVTAVHCTAGYNILAIFPFSGKSHYHMFRAIMDALVSHGHNVTVVSHFPKTSVPLNEEKLRDDDGYGTYTDYSLVGTVPLYENFTTDQVTSHGYFNEFLLILQDGLENCEGVLSSGRVNELIQSQPSKYDLVIVEVSHDDQFEVGNYVDIL